MLRMWVRAQSSQKYTRLPFSTEQVQVRGSPLATAPQRAHAVVVGAVPTRSD